MAVPIIQHVKAFEVFRLKKKEYIIIEMTHFITRLFKHSAQAIIPKISQLPFDQNNLKNLFFCIDV